MEDFISRIKLGDAIDRDAVISRNIKTYSLRKNRILHNNVLFATIIDNNIKLSYAAILDNAAFSAPKFDKVVIVGSEYFKLPRI